MLGLAAGGTEFCQALTVIIDDTEARLPLDPTKQGIAFGNQAYGHVHKENLYAIVGCMVKFYYKHHLKKFGGKKTILSAKIGDFVHTELPENLKTCGNSELTDYGVRFIHTKDNRIQVDHTFSIGVEHGPDTIFRLLSETQDGRKAAKGKAPIDRVSRPTLSPAKKKQQVAKVDKPPAKKKQHVAKASTLPAKRKQHTAKVDKPCGGKRQRTAKITRLPAKMKGIRSSRRSRGKPKRYGDNSDPGSDEDDQDDNDSISNMDNSKVKTEVNGGENDEHPIDLCSSSDDEDDLVPANISPNSSPNDSAVNGAAEEVATDSRTLKIENAELESENTPANSSPNSSPNDSEVNDAVEEVATDSKTPKIEDAELESENTPANISPNDCEVNGAVEEAATDSKTLKIKYAELKSENTDLKARMAVLETENDSRVAVLETENDLLEKEIKNMRDELEESKRTVSVLKRMSNNGNCNNEENASVHV